MIYNYTGDKDDEGYGGIGHEIVVKCPHKKCGNVQRLKIYYRDGPVSFKKANEYQCNGCGKKIEFSLQGIVDP